MLSTEIEIVSANVPEFSVTDHAVLELVEVTFAGTVVAFKLIKPLSTLSVALTATSE